MTMSLTEGTAPRTLPRPALRLRTTTAAVRVSLHWFGVRKTLTTQQKIMAAESFGADEDFLSARKKLLDTKHTAFKAVTGVRGRILAYWRGTSLPYPEPGVRLIKQHYVEDFDHRMTEFRTELHEAVDQLDQAYADLKAGAERQLGELYNPDDYPPSLDGLFEVEWDFPNVQPPDYLMELNPELYEQERARVAARFEEAVRLAEEAFIGEFAKLVSHLTERLSAGSDSETKIFRDSAVSNLVDFFDRFRQLNVRSNDQLDDLVAQAQQIVQGVAPQNLRDNDDLRQHVATQLSSVQSVLDGMLVDRPRRRIIRRREQSQ